MADAIVESRYLSAGANRYTAAADWGENGFVAFGSDANVCLWDPTVSTGISHIISGHTAHVRAVKFLPQNADDRADQGGKKIAHLVTGGDDKQLRLWAIDLETRTALCTQMVQEHTEPINCIASLKSAAFAETGSGRCLFVTGGADATVRVWALEAAGQMTLLQTIKTTRKYMPLAVALSELKGGSDGNGLVLAVAGTTNTIQIFTAAMPGGGDSGATIDFTLQATLPGHENWVRSLDFTREKLEPGSDLLLASASQDKYIRIWRIHHGNALSALNAAGLDMSADSLTPGNKIHKLTVGTGDGAAKYCIMFEALLLGHEDWIYSARWSRAASDGRLQLLSASADNSLSLWESDAESGIWITGARLGEISREKGATTATGSIGGFWTGLWSPLGETVITLGRTGSWRRWDYGTAEDTWKQNFAISGHTRAVTGISWSRDGLYLLSTSSDQTTRLHAEWALGAAHSWHEMSRPQIHGYDLNCISVLGPSSFVSGADEKLMRVFTEPKAIARMLSRLTNSAPLTPETEAALPDAANMPVLGLSNKAIDTIPDDADLSALAPDFSNPIGADRTAPDPATFVRTSALANDHPPFEESLSRHTLWPEIEKLYGHGYEISCLAASHDGRLVASACKASSLNHAVVRLFETRRWTEIRPPLQAHTLTVARLRFSADDSYLVSVGRDRGWAVWGRKTGKTASEGGQEGEEDGYELVQANPKGHTRMILDAAWAPAVKLGQDSQETVRIFATAGRDKLVKIWLRKPGDGSQFELAKAIPRDHPVTALDFIPETEDGQPLQLAVGTEAGKVSIFALAVKLDGSSGEVSVEVVSTLEVPNELSLPKAVTQLAWRPVREESKSTEELAIAGEDGSLRIYAFKSLRGG
ncbi:WD40-repeat-containing domain protein [Dichotomopilus funicola]|uniref:Elongator complex protein 2 n=1 Tax=Dichotomopilus funicola TaxID=1934379 RepID=A0AAN6VBM5_9PEZI|nr:WD40-repeat-containing domain protein [Dichotomopilus funicola]